MTGQIQPVVAMHDESGVIQVTYYDNGRHGEDGTVLDGLITHRIYDLGSYSTISEYVQRHVWCNDLGWWKEVSAKPNIYAYWDTAKTPANWGWDVNRLLNDIRIERDSSLTTCDWTQVTDSPLTESQKQDWATYRQALRDLPSSITTEESLEDVVWPTPPA